MPLDLIAVGDVMLDGALPAPVAGGRVHGRIELRAGGSAANAAFAAAGLGARAAVVGRVGADAAGRLVADELAAAATRSCSRGRRPLRGRRSSARGRTAGGFLVSLSRGMDPASALRAGCDTATALLGRG